MMCDGTQPLKDKVVAVMKIDTPQTPKELHSFIGVVNYHRDMWMCRSHVLVPLATLTSKTPKWKWTTKEQTAFDVAKKIIA